MMRSKVVSWAAALAVMLGGGLGVVWAQVGAGAVYVPQADGALSAQPLYSASYALVIGAADYQDRAAWPSLKGAAEDVRAVAQALEQQGFRVKRVMNPTGEQLDRVLRDFMASEGQELHARVLVYFAGHGYTLQSGVSGRTTGYIVPVDAPNPNASGLFKRKAFSMDSLRELATSMEAKHALFVFDSCFAGTIFTARGPGVRTEYIRDIADKPARVFITAGDADQTVPDQSQFRRYFVTGLVDGRADLNGDGYITGSELGMYLQQEVTSLGGGSRKAQSPRVGKINDAELSRGDVVFNVPNRRAAPVPIDVEQRAWDAAQRWNTPAAYEMFLVQFPEGRYAASAKEKLEISRRAGVSETRQPSSAAQQECVKGVCFEMVPIPAGQFEMGSPESEQGRDSDEGPLHKVNVPAFWLGRTEVTQGLWKAVMGNNPSGFKDCGDNCPVENVSWNDAQAFIQKLNGLTGKKYRLPSESEWEYAARAETKTPYWWGEKASHEYANYGKDECCGGLTQGRDKWDNTAPVGQFPANAWGLYDMHGNVWEWVQDAWVDNYNGAPTDGSAHEGNNVGTRVIRGGSWLDFPQNLRSANRYGYSPGNRSGNLGLRLARTN